MPNSTERFSDRQYVRGRSARRSWDVIACAHEEEVISTVQGEWAVGQGTSHPLDARLVADAPEVVPVTPAGRMWRYTLPYAAQGGLVPISLDDAPRILWEPGFTTEPIDRDAFDNPIINSAGDTPSAYLTEEFPTMVLHVTRWESSYDVQKYFAYRNRVNSDTFTILNRWTVQPGQCRVVNYAPVEEFPLTNAIVRCRYSFEFQSGNKQDPDGRWDGFKKRFLDQGRNGWYDADGTVTKGAMYYASGERVADDKLLNGYGKAFEVGIKVGKGLAEPEPRPTDLPANISKDEFSEMTYLKYQTKKLAALAAIFN